MITAICISNTKIQFTGLNKSLVGYTLMCIDEYRDTFSFPNFFQSSFTAFQKSHESLPEINIYYCQLLSQLMSNER